MSGGIAAIAAIAAGVKSVSVYGIYESCERTTYFVRLVTDEGFSKDVEAHQTGSIYTNHEGLSVEEALDRALIDAATWGDFLNIEPDPYYRDKQLVEPSCSLSSYRYQRQEK